MAIEFDVVDTKNPLGTRKFYDPNTLREWVKENAKTAFADKLNQLESKDFKLVVKDVEYQNPNKIFSHTEQKQALLEKRDLTLPLRATFQLIDKRNGQVVDEKKTTVAQVPFVTNRNTTVYNGSEYIAGVNQMRLKPGIYTRIKETGEAEAHINVRPGTGLNGTVVFHPEKALFIYELGTTQIRLYGLLKGLGVTDAAMQAAWGKEIFQKNKQAFKGDEIDKFFNKVFVFKQ